MKIDNTTYKILEEVATSNGVTMKEVEKALDGYYKAVADTIKETEPVEIKMDFLGKFIPNMKKFNDDRSNSN